MRDVVVCTAIKAGAGEFTSNDGNVIAYDSTTFYLAVELSESKQTRTMGRVSRPFKFGDSKEFDKWVNWIKVWPDSGILVDVEFDISANGSDGVKLVLKSIKPAKTEKAVVSQ